MRHKSTWYSWHKRSPYIWLMAYRMAQELKAIEGNPEFDEDGYYL